MEPPHEKFKHSEVKVRNVFGRWSKCDTEVVGWPRPVRMVNVQGQGSVRSGSAWTCWLGRTRAHVEFQVLCDGADGGEVGAVVEMLLHRI